jgi:hypothetical protein
MYRLLTGGINMAENINELQKQILQKTLILDSLNNEEKPKNEKILNVKAELDKLLYRYFKSVKCKCNSGVFLCLDW